MALKLSRSSSVFSNKRRVISDTFYYKKRAVEVPLIFLYIPNQRQLYMRQVHILTNLFQDHLHQRPYTHL